MKGNGWYMRKVRGGEKRRVKGNRKHDGKQVVRLRRGCGAEEVVGPGMS